MKFEEAVGKMQEVHTNGANYGISTEDIIAKLKEWATKCKFTIGEVTFDKVELEFQSLPANLAEFCKDIYAFCPDTVDQGYGCVAEMIDAAEDMDQEIDEATQELIAGVDLEAEDYGLELMRRDLPKKMKMTLWWD
jgi:hypothetical protein